MSGQAGRSKLYSIKPLINKFPEIKSPRRHVSFKEKFIWSGIALIIYLIMMQIPLHGAEIGAGEGFFGHMQYVLASEMGTLMQLGIGPIVTAGIMMQLLTGADLINLNLSNPQDKALFTGTQKILTILVAILQGSAFVFGGVIGAEATFGVQIWIVAQLVMGAAVVLFLDEMVSKYGFGSGISLFIAGSVSAQIFYQAFAPLTVEGEMVGAIPNFISALASGEAGAISDAFVRGQAPGATMPDMLGVFGAILIFLIVIYAVNTRVEIPLSYSEYGGMRGRYPIKFFYTSVIPIILAHVVITNFQILGGIIGGAFEGFVDEWLTAPQGVLAVSEAPLQAVFYLAVLVLLCMGFSWLWAKMTNMGPSDVADQLKRSGMSIPGFRKDTRMMEKILARYIKPVALLGGATVGLLSVGADFVGALSSGTGILLAASIIHRLYEEIAQEQLSEMFPAARRLLGND